MPRPTSEIARALVEKTYADIMRARGDWRDGPGGFTHDDERAAWAHAITAALDAERREGDSVAMADVAAERQRQVEVEGWTAEHDDEHGAGELASAAAAYALHRTNAHRGVATTVWPWSWHWWKPKDRRRDLVRAAALIVAEIERLDRAKETDRG